MAMVNKARTIQKAGLSGTAVSNVLVITGAVLAPVTFGGSLALTAIGGVVGLVAASGGFAAVALAVHSMKRLRKAQAVIDLDQQISLIINEDAHKYYQMMTQLASHPAEAENTEKTAAVARHATDHVAGTTGASSAVTDSLIAYHSYHIHKTRNVSLEKIKMTEKPERIIRNLVEALFKGT